MAKVSVIGRLRIAIRIMVLAILFLAYLLPYYVWRMLRLPNPWPKLVIVAANWVMGIELRITGQRLHSNEFLVVNHVSWIDITALFAASGAAFVANDGLGSHPFTRWMCSMNGAVLVARHDRASVQAQVERVRRAVNSAGALAIFPEGTTSDGTGLLPFKSSLLSALDPLPSGVAVQPVLLDYGPDAASLAWIGEEQGLVNFKRLMAQSGRIRVGVHFLPQLSGAALANRKSIALASRDAILRELALRRSSDVQRVAL